MNSKLIKASSALTLFVLMASVVASNAPAFAINGHGISYGPQFGEGPYKTYNDGLKINGATFDISKYSTTLNTTQVMYVNDRSDITLKIFHHSGGEAVQHVIVFLNLQGDNPQTYQTKTYIDWTKGSGVSTSDPTGIFKQVNATAKYNGQLVYLRLHIVPAKPMNTSHMIVRAWDSDLSTGQVIVKNAIKIQYVTTGSSKIVQ